VLSMPGARWLSFLNPTTERMPSGEVPSGSGMVDVSVTCGRREGIGPSLIRRLTRARSESSDPRVFLRDSGRGRCGRAERRRYPGQWPLHGVIGRPPNLT